MMIYGVLNNKKKFTFHYSAPWHCLLQLKLFFHNFMIQMIKCLQSYSFNHTIQYSFRLAPFWRCHFYGARYKWQRRPGLGLGLDRIQCGCMRTFRSALRFLGIPRKRRFLKIAEHIIIHIYIYGRRKNFSPFTVRTTGRVIPFCFHSVSVPFLFNFCAVAVLVRFQTVPVFVPRAARPFW